jgi:hypothetical protein
MPCKVHSICSCSRYCRGARGFTATPSWLPSPVHPAKCCEWIKNDTGRRARIYELTAAGKKQLGAEESRWQSVSLAINRVLREA